MRNRPGKIVTGDRRAGARGASASSKDRPGAAGCGRCVTRVSHSFSWSAPSRRHNNPPLILDFRRLRINTAPSFFQRPATRLSHFQAAFPGHTGTLSRRNNRVPAHATYCTLEPRSHIGSAAETRLVRRTCTALQGGLNAFSVRQAGMSGALAAGGHRLAVLPVPEPDLATQDAMLNEASARSNIPLEHLGMVS